MFRDVKYLNTGDGGPAYSFVELQDVSTKDYMAISISLNGDSMDVILTEDQLCDLRDRLNDFLRDVTLPRQRVIVDLH
jgi:hypothetical protein